jgi:surface antigen
MKRVALMMTVLFWAMFGYSPAYGQVYGEQLGEPEQRAMMETFQYALEYNKTNEASAWVNPDTGRSGTLVPVRTYQNESGQYCREYVTTITIGGEEVQGYGTACRQPDGTWLIVSDEPAAATKAEYQTVVNKVYYVYPYGYPYWYNYYPYYVWDYWYPHIFFSFDIVHFSGHHHHHHFHHGRHFHHWFHGHR